MKSAVVWYLRSQVFKMSLAARGEETIGRLGSAALAYQFGQVQGESRSGHHRVYSGSYGGAHCVGVLDGGHHGVDRYHSSAFGNLLGFADLLPESPEIGLKGILCKIGFQIARVGRC